MFLSFCRVLRPRRPIGFAQNTRDTAPATTGNSGEVWLPADTRYCPGSRPRTPKKPLPSVVVVRVACVVIDSTVTVAPSRAPAKPITAPIVAGGFRGAG